MRVQGIYRFDASDPALSLLPMAARRALDCAGLHLSLRGWQKLSVAERWALVSLGAADVVDVPRVRASVSALAHDVRAEPALLEPAASAGPSAELLAALPQGHGLTSQLWCELSALDRYVLQQLARRGKRERLAQAFAEIRAGSGA